MRSNPIFSKRTHLGLALVASLGVIGLTGCGGGDGDSARIAQMVDASKNTVTKIAIADNDQYVHFKSFYQFELIGTDDAGTQTNLTNKATWKISDSSLGKIKNGYFTAAGVAGNFTLTAEYAGIVAATQEISVSDANLIEVTVVHPTGSVNECQNTDFTAQALFDNGKILPYNLTWKVLEADGIASFNDPDKSTLNTKNSGSIRVVASGINNSGQEVTSGEFNFTVNDALSSVAISTGRTSNEMRDGESTNVTVRGTYGSQTVDITGNATISATPANLLAIEGTKITAQNGNANGLSVTLTGSCGGAEGTQQLTIKERQIKSIEIKNGEKISDIRLVRGGNIDLNVTAIYSDDNKNENYTNVVWKIDYRNAAIADSEKSKITLSSTTGELSTTSDLNLSASSIVIYVIAEVHDSTGAIIKSPSGADLKDEIDVTISLN